MECSAAGRLHHSTLVRVGFSRHACQRSGPAQAARQLHAGPGSSKHHPRRQVAPAAAATSETPDNSNTSNGSSFASGIRMPATQDTHQPAASVAANCTAVAPGGSSSAAVTQRLLLWCTMLAKCWVLLKRNLWPMLVAHAVTDAAVFLLHRLSHLATNEVAVAVLGTGTVTREAIGNMWWLSVNPAIANFDTGYQYLTILFFLAAFPLNVYIKTWASLATILLCQQALLADGTQKQGVLIPEQPPWWQPLKGLKLAWDSLRGLQPQVADLWCPVFLVELLVAAVVVPLQFISLAIITLPLTLPFILDLQASGPVAVAEGMCGFAALKRSRKLLCSMRWQLAIPFVGLVAAGRLLEHAKTALIQAMPGRYYQELTELPLGVLVGSTLLSVLLARMQDVLPFVAYTTGLQAREAAIRAEMQD